MRSWLFVPGDSERKLEKAASSGADVVIIDLQFVASRRICFDDLPAVGNSHTFDRWLALVEFLVLVFVEENDSACGFGHDRRLLRGGNRAQQQATQRSKCYRLATSSFHDRFRLVHVGRTNELPL